MKLLLVTYFFLLFASQLFGQKSNRPIGLYSKCPKSYMSCEQIQFNADSTFKYAVFYDVGGLVTWEGTWSTDVDTIIINSYKQPQTEEDKKIVEISYGFYQSGFIIDLKFLLKGKRLFTTDMETKKICLTEFLKKTSINNKIF
jgi:hypothetical protein